MLLPEVKSVTEKITLRSHASRTRYLALMERNRSSGNQRRGLSCSNLAHGCAAASGGDKTLMIDTDSPNVGIVTAYNDMLSAHAPYADYPRQIRQALAASGATAQVAGGVPAMCDGITQGQAAMELSLFSRDQIALSTAIALSHHMFDAVACLGICDKIVPGLLMGALRFAHLPVIFIPAGPMPSGISNREKQALRKRFQAGEITEDALLAMEMRAYHSPGTCTFYGTANSNQMLMEIMGLQLPGSSFINPGTDLRNSLTAAAAQTIVTQSAGSDTYRPLSEIVTEKAIVNAVVGLLATGGSTNHTMHLVAIAHCAGIRLTWQDFDELSRIVPLLTRMYPNGTADVNRFHAAGGMPQVIRNLLDLGLLHDDVETVVGPGLRRYTKLPILDENTLVWQEVAEDSSDTTVIARRDTPFQAEGGIRILSGNLGQSVIKVSAVPREYWCVEAPSRVFNSQAELQQAFSEGKLNCNMVAVVRWQGPRALGMPELHKLTPTLAVLQDRGYRVALVTDGRMSGASGRVPAAIHLTPEAADGGELARIRDGDIIRLDAGAGTLDVLVDKDELARRPAVTVPPETQASNAGWGRELFAHMRANTSAATQGATIFTEF